MEGYDPDSAHLQVTAEHIGHLQQLQVPHPLLVHSDVRGEGGGQAGEQVLLTQVVQTNVDVTMAMGLDECDDRVHSFLLAIGTHKSV